MRDILEQLDRITFCLLESDSDDPTVTEELRRRFEELAQSLGVAGAQQAAGVALASADWISSWEPCNQIEEFETLSETITALQAMVRDGKDAAQAGVPMHLVSTHREGQSHSSGCFSGTLGAPDPRGDELMGIFVSELAEHLDLAEEHLIALDDDPGNGESLAAVFRAFHTIKGAAGMARIDAFIPLAHEVETLLDLARSGRFLLTSSALDVILRCVDALNLQAKALQMDPRGDGTWDRDDSLKRLVDEIRDLIASQDPPEAAESDSPGRLTPPAEADGSLGLESASETDPQEESADDGLSFYSQDPEMLAGFVCEAQEHLEAAESHLLTLEANPSEQASLDNVFRSFHSIKGVAGFLELHDISTLAHEAENMLDKARDGFLTLTGNAMDLALESLDSLKRHVELVREGMATGGSVARDPELPSLLERLQRVVAGAASCAASTSQLPPAESSPDRVESSTVPDARTSSDAVEHASAPAPTCPSKDVSRAAAGPSGRSRPSAARAPQGTETVKVDRGRLDELIDLIGELVIAESMVHEDMVATQAAEAGSLRNATQLRKITRELQELSLSLRMVPINGLFQKMARLVRDLSRKLDKPIDFHIEGGETELDKTVVDQVADPLVHIVRNAVDHGIEDSTDVRTAQGKPARGNITLRAFHQGGNIYIELEDDGRGLDRDAILAKARNRGIIPDDHKLTDREVFNLIFAPGFSTAQQVTDVSGRGVGMDVVRRNIEALRGSVELQSQFGKGTVISLRLPLTLAIIDGMVVRVAGQRYIIPTPVIIELVRPEPSDLATVAGRGELLAVRGRNVPFFRIGSLFGLEDAQQDPTAATIVLVEDKEQMVGLLVDEIVGQQQVVIKALGETLAGVGGMSGCAVMPDGQVGLILDVHGLLALARGPQTAALA